jgi:hypothetical protein
MVVHEPSQRAFFGRGRSMNKHIPETEGAVSATNSFGTAHDFMASQTRRLGSKPPQPRPAQHSPLPTPRSDPTPVSVSPISPRGPDPAAAAPPALVTMVRLPLPESSSTAAYSALARVWVIADPPRFGPETANRHSPFDFYR